MEQHTSTRSWGEITLGTQPLHYSVLGSGKQLVFAFHGYANAATLFDFAAQEDCTVLSFDLPYQGKSNWVEDQLVRPEDLVQLLQVLMKQFGVTQCGLLGFSLGTRYCLTLLTYMPNQINCIVLVAPDGIRRNNLFHFLTCTVLGHFLFRHFVDHGSGYLRLFAALQQLGLIPRERYLFAMQYIRHQTARRLLYQIWMSTRLLQPNLRQLQSQLLAPSVPIHLFMGRYDRIIPLANGIRFKRLMPCVQLHVFEKGHKLIEDPEVHNEIKQILRHPSILP
jgi:pimeloyl-ACP methyl ester carboxylesterase